MGNARQKQWMFWICVVLLAVAHVSLGQVAGEGTTPATQSGEELIALQFPPDLELKVLIQYVGDRLGINFIYDEQTVAQKITLVSPVKISKSSLLGLLQSALKMKSLIIVDADQPGWKKIIPVPNLFSAAGPAGRSSGPASQPSAVVTQVFTLQYADASRADAVIKPYLSQPGGNTIVLAEQHLLIVSDFASTIARISDLLHLLDRPPQDVDIQFIPIKNVDVGALVPQLQQINAARDKAISGGTTNAPAQTLEIVQDTRTNQMIVIGPPAKVSALAGLTTQLDVPLPLETKVYNLRSISPDRLDKLVRELIDPADAKRLYQSASDKDSGLLIATTTQAIHQRIEGLKEQLDLPISEQASPIRFYKLTNTTAADVLATIRSLEEEQQTNEGAGGPTVPLSPAPGPGAAPLANPNSQTQLPQTPSQEGGPSPAMPYAQQGLAPSLSAPSGTVPPTGGTPAPQPIAGVHTAKGTITADPNTNTIIVEADPATQKMYEGLIKMLDKRRPQVLIECTLVTIDTSGNFSVGVEVGGDTKGSPRVVTFNSFGLSTPDPSTGVLTLKPGPGFNGTLLNSSVAQIVIQALATDSRARVLSAPRILVNDNATGTLSSVAEQPFTSVNASNTVATTSFAGYATAGTTITLTPHISEGDHLQLEYLVTLNNFTGQATNGVPPPRQTDSVQSKITVPDDSTIVVGGLNSTNTSAGRQTIPFIGDIPVIRHLFSQQNRADSHSTLFVFIRPLILRDDQFQDLKLISEQDAKAAGLSGDFPMSQPLLMR